MLQIGLRCDILDFGKKCFDLLIGSDKMLPIYMVLVDDDDVSDFEVLYREYRNKAYIIAYKILKNESLAEECVSEVFFLLRRISKKLTI